MGIDKLLLEVISRLKETNGHLNRLVTQQTETNRLMRIGFNIATPTIEQRVWKKNAQAEKQGTTRN